MTSEKVRFINTWRLRITARKLNYKPLQVFFGVIHVGPQWGVLYTWTSLHSINWTFCINILVKDSVLLPTFNCDRNFAIRPLSCHSRTHNSILPSLRLIPSHVGNYLKGSRTRPEDFAYTSDVSGNSCWAPPNNLGGKYGRCFFLLDLSHQCSCCFIVLQLTLVN